MLSATFNDLCKVVFPKFLKNNQYCQTQFVQNFLAGGAAGSTALGLQGSRIAKDSRHYYFQQSCRAIQEHQFHPLNMKWKTGGHGKQGWMAEGVIVRVVLSVTQQLRLFGYIVAPKLSSVNIT